MANKTTETKKVVKKTAVKSVAKEAPKKVSKTVATESETKKVAPKGTVKAEAAVAVVTPKKVEKTYATVSIDVVGIDGKAGGKMSLPGEIFGEKLNKPLLAQAVRVYLANQRQGNASTKTRGEVDGSTRKIYRQKGTGRARHGGIRAPIFVKGGVVFGPKPRDFSLSFPQKMKRKALFVALSAKVKDNEITVVDGMSKIEPKTKNFFGMLEKLELAGKKQNILVVTAGDTTSVLRAGRNVQGVSFVQSKLINTYEVLTAKRIVMMKDAVDEMKAHFLKK
ncbi:MAG TPA: 50S ribosomal protein L4 [Candidatus Saccharimonadales bacterium]|nr:50S ribosomal protein L4 [Candidatus Saccharimonadales bacterium]